MANVKHAMMTEEMVEELTKPGTYGDGDGLTLRVSKTWRKHWVLRVTISGRPRNIGLGSYPAVGLAEARERAKENLAAIRQGQDPVRERRAAMEQANPQASVPTFRVASATVIEYLTPTWRTPDSAKQWERSLSNHILPVLGDKLLSEITPSDITKVLTPIWLEKEETARRVLQRMARIFDFAVEQDWRQDNPAGKHILRSLPKQNRQRQHYPALNYHEVPNALATVRDSSADQITKLAIEFMVLCAARSGEVCSAHWSEIDIANGVWKMPATKTKTLKEHLVPLSDPAVEIITEARALTGGEGLVFPSMRSIQRGEPKRLSNTAFAVLMKRLEIPGVPHGMRHSFRNWAWEQQDGSDLAADCSLGLPIVGMREQSLTRFVPLEDQRRLLQNWATFLKTGESPSFK